ncbi:MAG: hypothetical protein N3G74_00485 [Candidatus Micrarchaeota archaeon]|nr:hypothetical protein [Candidatus Micrarchaeota archaeon]
MGKSKNRLKNEYFIKKTSVILLMLLQHEKATISQLSKSSGVSFLYCANKIKEMESAGFVVSAREKKFRFVFLTEKGVRLAEKIKEVAKLISESEQAEMETAPIHSGVNETNND